MLLRTESFVHRSATRGGIEVSGPIGLGFGLSDLDIDYDHLDEEGYTFYHSLATCKDLVKWIIRESYEFMVEQDLERRIPVITLLQTNKIFEDILSIEFIAHDNPGQSMHIDMEPMTCLYEKWRRADCPTQVIEFRGDGIKNKNMKKSKVGYQSPRKPSVQSPSKRTGQKLSLPSEPSFSKVNSSISVEVVVLEVDDEPESQSIWGSYDYQQVDMSGPKSFDHLEEQLRVSYLNGIQMKIERDELNAQRQHQYDSDQKAFKTQNNTLRDKKKDFTYDYDGKMLIQKKLQKKKLPPVNPKTQIATHVEDIKMNQQFLTQQERDLKASKPVSVASSTAKTKLKPQVKLKLNFKPGLQRYSQSAVKDYSNDPAQDIIRQQETNQAHGYMDKFQMRPGVSLQLGTNYKAVETSSSISQLPYQIQSHMLSYLSVQQKQAIKLTKSEYDNIITNDGDMTKLYQDKSMFNKSGGGGVNKILKDISLQSLSSKSKGGYSKIYSLKKSGTQQNLPSLFDESIIIDGSVKINDIGRFYDLFMKESESDSIIIDDPKEIIEHEKTPPKAVNNSRKSKLTNKIWGDNPKPKDNKLPFLPLSHLYKQLDKPSGPQDGILSLPLQSLKCFYDFTDLKDFTDSQCNKFNHDSQAHQRSSKAVKHRYERSTLFGCSQDRQNDGVWCKYDLQFFIIIMKQIYTPVNGFNQTPHLFQVTAVLLFISDLWLASLIIVYERDFLFQIISATLFCALSMLVISYFTLVSLSDPTDNRVISHIQKSSLVQESTDFFCETCKCDVGERSKHCKTCKRCVSDFDHHCKWLNNCIGGKNYDNFYKLIICAINFQVLYGVILAKSLSDQFRIFEIIRSISLIFNVLLFIPQLCLLILHSYLKVKKLSTFDWIRQNRMKAAHKPQKVRINQVGIEIQNLGVKQFSILLKKKHKKQNDTEDDKIQNINLYDENKGDQIPKLILDDKSQAKQLQTKISEFSPISHPLRPQLKRAQSQLLIHQLVDEDSHDNQKIQKSIQMKQRTSDHPDYIDKNIDRQHVIITNQYSQRSQ